jgi:hypothetical protein
MLHVSMLFLIWKYCSLYPIIIIQYKKLVNVLETYVFKYIFKHMHLGISRTMQCICPQCVCFPTRKKIKREKRNQKKITKVTSLLLKHPSKAYVTLQDPDKIMNTKGPNIQLFSIPFVLTCKMLNAQKVHSKGCKLSLQLLE